MPETIIRRLSEQERNNHLEQIKSAVQGIVETFTQNTPQVVNLTKTEHLDDWFRDSGNWTFITLSVTDFIGVSQPGSPKGSYEMVLPDQHGELFEALEPKIISAIEAVGYKVTKEGLKEQFFRVNLI